MEEKKSEPVTVTKTFDNEWKVVLTPEGWMEDHGHYYNVDFVLSAKNGNTWNLEIRGQIKYNGCADLGYGEQVMIHFCNRSDCEVFYWIYDESKKVGGW